MFLTSRDEDLGHLVMLIQSGMHVTECNPGYIVICSLSCHMKLAQHETQRIPNCAFVSTVTGVLCVTGEGEVAVRMSVNTW